MCVCVLVGAVGLEGGCLWRRFSGVLSQVQSSCGKHRERGSEAWGLLGLRLGAGVWDFSRSSKGKQSGWRGEQRG